MRPAGNQRDIKALSRQEALDTLAGLTPVKFVYKADRSEQHVGFIAEDVPRSWQRRTGRG